MDVSTSARQLAIDGRDAAVNAGDYDGLREHGRAERMSFESCESSRSTGADESQATSACSLCVQKPVGGMQMGSEKNGWTGGALADGAYRGLGRQVAKG